MADERLIFPVGFDLDSSIEQVEKDWGKIQRRMQKVIDEKPLTIKMTAGTVDNYKTFSRNARNSINEIREALDSLSKKWNEMADMEKFDESGNLTAKAQGMIQRYNGLTAALETYGRTLSQVVAMEKKSIEQELKTINANRAAYEAQIKANAQKAAADAKNRADYEKYVNQLRQQQNAETVLTQKGLAAERQRVELRRQAKQASDNEYQSLVRQLRMEEQLAAAEANRARQQKYNAARKQGLERLKILNAEEKSIAAITAKLQVQQKRLQSATFGSAKFKKIADEVKRLSKLLDEANAKIRGVDEAERRRVLGINATTAAYGRQMSYVERLVTRLGIYAGIYAAAGMLRHIRETTAEFELQEVALGAIVKDAHQARVLFSQIKAAAVESPYQIKELVDYTKQLAAYGFEQNKLFDTTMKLADISAGLGADMSRIILAVGQVSAATVLKGTELRQFTELGIPMVELLAEKFTELRGEIVSTGEVFDMISDKAVSFQMVEEILNDLTSAGGMFYDMQRKQAETLAGQWSNLKDSIAIAYDEIGNTGTVRGAMEGVISLLKAMVDNWERTSAVLSGLVAGIATYVAAVKTAALVDTVRNRTIASTIKLVRAATIAQPKWVAAIIGETRAKSVNLVMTKALRVARLKEAAATNLAAKAFWSLTAAMLANPYGIIIAAVAALGIAIYNLVKQTKSAKEYVDDLNESVSSLSSLEKSVRPLVEELESLSSQSDKTAREQKRLDQVTKELADRYPAAISAVKKYGEEVEITAGKVRELYEAETLAAKKGIEAQLEESRTLLKRQQKEYDEIVSSILSGKKTVVVGGGAGIPGVAHEISMTSEDIAALKKRMDELAGSIKDTQEAIKSAEIALGILPSEAQSGVDAFGAWKKELEGFILSYKTADGKDIQLFDDQQIDRFKDLNEALDETVKIREENTKAVKKYNEILKSTTLNDDTRDKIKIERDHAQAHIDTADAIIKHFNAWSLLQDKEESKTKLQVLNEEVSLLEKVYAKYKEYARYRSSAEAERMTRDYFGETIKSLRFGPAFDAQTMASILKQYQDAARALPDSKKEVLEIGFKADDASWKQVVEDIKERVKDLTEAVSRSKEAQNFYDSMLGMTGDRQLSADITMSVYGGVGDDLKENIKRQLTEAFKGVDISEAVSGKNIDYKALEKLVGTLPKDMQANARKIVEEGIKANADIIQDLYKTLIKFEDYEDKRMTILRNGIEQRRKIEQADIAQSEKDRLRVASQNEESKALAKLDYEQFKSSDMYITMFENLDYVSADTLKRMKERLLELKTTLGENLDPNQMKEIVTKMEAIDAELSRKNPFKTLAESIRKYKDEYEKVRRKGLESDLLSASKEQEAAKADVKTKQKAVLAQEEIVRLAEEKYGKDSMQAKVQQDILRMAKADLGIAERNLKKKDETLDNLNDQARAWRNIKNAIQEAIEGEDGIVDWLNSAQSMLDSIKNLGEGMGAGEEFSGWLDAISGVVGGAGTTANGIGQILSGQWAQGLANVVKGLSEVALGIFDASYVNRVAAANAEIEKQAVILEDLDRAYQQLEKSAENAFGTEYLDNYQDRLTKLYAMQAAYQAQADAERDKGKKADEDTAKDFETQAQEIADQITEMYGEISERLTGSDLGSAARDFANAWLEAYKTFGNTADSIGEKFREMIDNMVAESVIAGVMKTALEPVFKMIDNMRTEDLYDPGFWQGLQAEIDKATEDADVGATNAMRMLEALGINIREMGAGLTGISKDIATASEESILGLAAGINTQNFYISQIHAAVLRIEMLMQSGGTGVNVQDLITIQNQHLAHLPNIAANTANTLAECQAILLEVRRVADNMDRVITPIGTSSTHQLHTTLS